MSTRIWRGDAVAVAQVTTWLFAGTWEASDIVDVTINTKTISTTGGSTTISTVVDAVVAALNASTIPEFAEITWSRSSDSLVATGDTAGKPFTVTVSTRDAGGAADSQTIEGGTSSTGTTSTAATGPNHWNDADNWTGNAVPVNSDDVVIENSAVDILYGLAQSAVTLTSLTIKKSYTGKIGLPTFNESGGYYEYRDTYLAISATTVSVGEGTGIGSGRIKLDTGSNAATVNVFGAGQPEDTDVPAFCWKGAHASNAMNVYSGSVGVAALAGETATLPTLRISYTTNLETDAQVYCGSGATLTTIDKVGGELTINSAATTITQTGGTLTTYGSGAITTVNLRDDGSGRPQTFYSNSSGTITTLNISGDATTVDFSRSMIARTVTTTNRYGLAAINDPFKKITWTNGIDCEQSDARNLFLGTNINVQRAAVS